MLESVYILYSQRIKSIEKNQYGISPGGNLGGFMSIMKRTLGYPQNASR